MMDHLGTWGAAGMGSNLGTAQIGLRTVEMNYDCNQRSVKVYSISPRRKLGRKNRTSAYFCQNKFF